MMQLVKSQQIIDELAKFDDYFSSSGTDCWKTLSGTIHLYVFSTIYETVKDLEENYKELRDHVAISFQSRTLQNPAERWNLYILYLVKEFVPQELKQIILQDKFSARKMVCSTGDDEITDEYVNSIISKTLIDIDIPERQLSIDRLEELMIASHPEVAAAIEKIDAMNTRENLKQLIKFLSDEQN
ncbi:hypothetical protein AB670_00112 [Chryseobacterium sp. MOF25P]|nr:hypothetical protein AB670_00112 [Chryseobacterium sp. MOF25P]OBW46644.1 hypothetical protein AB671_01139 [Chryseobacterium sp. BGARF1]